MLCSGQTAKLLKVIRAAHLATKEHVGLLEDVASASAELKLKEAPESASEFSHWLAVRWNYNMTPSVVGFGEFLNSR